MQNKNMMPQGFDLSAASSVLTTVGFVGVAILVLGFSSIHVIDAGQYGVKKVWGDVRGAPLGPGIYFTSPISTVIVKYNTRLQVATGQTQAYTRDVQQALIDYQIGYSVRPDAVALVEKTVGSDWENMLLMDLVSDSLKNVIGKWEAMELVANRDKISPQVLEGLRARLADKAESRGLPEDVVILSSFAISNIDFSDDFERASEARATAIQRAEEAKNTTVRIQEEANQKVIAAKAEAESMRIRADALSQNRNLVEYEAVQKWNGILPQYMMGNSVPFISLGGK